MMELLINRELLLKAINLIAKAADKRNPIQILANIKLKLRQDVLIMTASDSEVELNVRLTLAQGACIQEGEITLPADKLQNICKLLPANTQIHLKVEENHRCQIVADKSRFSLGTLPAEEYPMLGNPNDVTALQINRSDFISMISKTQFAMAVQDVRYYLTGMLFEVSHRLLTAVATDGHRLALAKRAIDVDETLNMQAILPRKAVTELERLLNDLGKLLKSTDNPVNLKFGREFLQVALPFGAVDSTGQIDDSVRLTFTARLIDGNFPDYRRIMPHNHDKQAIIQLGQIKDVLRRVSIMSNEKSRGVILTFSEDGTIEFRANNSEHDEAVEKLAAKYTGSTIEMSFNAQYLQEMLEVLEGDLVLQMSQANASVLASQHGDELHQYVVMPMRV